MLLVVIKELTSESSFSLKNWFKKKTSFINIKLKFNIILATIILEQTLVTLVSIQIVLLIITLVRIYSLINLSIYSLFIYLFVFFKRWIWNSVGNEPGLSCFANSVLSATNVAFRISTTIWYTTIYQFCCSSIW